MSKLSIVVVDLRDEVERRKAYSLNEGRSKKLFDGYIEDGYVQFGYDEQTGDVLFALDKNHKLIYVDNRNVEFKNINQIV